MADNIGVLIPTIIPALDQEANIQTALRFYHYGDEEYNPSNPTASNLPSVGIARYIYDLQTAVNNLETTTGIQESEITAKGDLLVGTAFETVGVLSLPTSPSPEGYVLTVKSAETTGLSWEPVQVSLAGEEILSNKILTLPRIVSGGGITDNSNDFRRYITFNTVPDGVNHISITNAVAASGPTISTVTSDIAVTNSDLNLAALGTGKVKIGGSEIVTLAASQTLTNKTLTSPAISTISNTGTLTLPTSTDTLIGRATTDTLTNKTLTAESVDFVSTTGTNRKFKFAISGISDGTTVTLTVPTANSTLATTSTSQSFTNKNLSDNTNTISIGTDATNSNSVSTGIISAFNNKANLAAATFTGTVTVPNNVSTRTTGLIVGTARIYVGSTTPTGASSGDIWIRSA